MSSLGWLGRPQSVITILALVVLSTIAYHIHQVPHQNFISSLRIYQKPQPYFRDDPKISTMSNEEKKTNLLNLASKLSATEFPKHIYQTWKTIALGSNAAYNHQSSWFKKNPSHEYTLLTDKTAQQYVTENFATTDPYIVKLYNQVTQRILAADLLRYLIAFKSGGLYTDIDTECNVSIDDWMGKSISHMSKAGIKASDINVIVGMELDVLNKTRYPDNWIESAGFSQRIQFLQWSVYAKPGHEILRRMVTSVQEAMREDVEKTAAKRIADLRYTNVQILDKTGPFRWTRVIMEYVDQIEGRKVELEEYSGLHEAKKFGDVLFLPVNRWSPGVPHSDAGGRETSFLVHHFGGSWKGN
ncbi:membrane-bound alpha-1,6- mannosyltransferase Initiation-specific [Orbilia ellipsospora]|uniref:Membrane-bound alpha-1,6- mannosyltransferase Initiation-specific n=1 Tax=Orbilia ellipsospora TaxID=2528407 RepID=A0AAV9WZ51_9PEZI